MDWIKLFVIGNAAAVEALCRTEGLDQIAHRPPVANEYSSKCWLDDDLIRHEHGRYCNGLWEDLYRAYFANIFSEVKAGNLGVVVAVHVIHMHDTEHCNSCANYIAAAGFSHVEEFMREDYINDADDSGDRSRDRMLAEAEFKYDKNILRALAALR